MLTLELGLQTLSKIGRFLEFILCTSTRWLINAVISTVSTFNLELSISEITRTFLEPFVDLFPGSFIYSSDCVSLQEVSRVVVVGANRFALLDLRPLN